MAIAAGGGHSLGLKSDGTIVAWGSGLDTVPEPNNGFAAIAAGTSHSLGLKSDGSVVAWGDNYYGQCNVPAPNEGFLAVAGGYGHSLGLKSDGTIVAWGSNDEGQCTVPVPNTGFVAIAAGPRHSLGLNADWNVVGWGQNNVGQCNVPAPNDGFVAIVAGGLFSLGLKSDGTIVAWGLNNEGQCNVPAPNDGFVAIAGGGEHSLGLKSDGTIVAWGRNDYGQCDIPTPNAGFAGVAAGTDISLAIRGTSPICGVTNLVASQTTQEGVLVSWSLSPSGCISDQVRVERAFTNPSSWTTLTTLSGSPLSFTDSPLSQAGTYYYRVTPLSSSGQAGTPATTSVYFEPSAIVLTSFSLTPSQPVVHRGEQFTATFNLTNHLATGQQAELRLLYRHGLTSAQAFPSTGGLVTVPSGSNSFDLQLIVPPDCLPGIYDAMWAVYEPGTNHLLGTSGGFAANAIDVRDWSSGPSLRVTIPEINFGSVGTNETSLPQVLTLKNVGTATLTVNDTFVNGQPINRCWTGGIFCLPEGTSFPLALPPNATADLPLQFTPDDTLPYDSRLTFASNDPNGATASVRLLGQGVPASVPRLSITGVVATSADGVTDPVALEPAKIYVTVRNVGSTTISTDLSAEAEVHDVAGMEPDDFWLLVDRSLVYARGDVFQFNSMQNPDLHIVGLRPGDESVIELSKILVGTKPQSIEFHSPNYADRLVVVLRPTGFSPSSYRRNELLHVAVNPDAAWNCASELFTLVLLGFSPDLEGIDKCRNQLANASIATRALVNAISSSPPDGVAIGNSLVSIAMDLAPCAGLAVNKALGIAWAAVNAAKNETEGNGCAAVLMESKVLDDIADTMCDDLMFAWMHPGNCLVFDHAPVELAARQRSLELRSLGLSNSATRTAGAGGMAELGDSVIVSALGNKVVAYVPAGMEGAVEFMGGGDVASGLRVTRLDSSLVVTHSFFPDVVTGDGSWLSLGLQGPADSLVLRVDDNGDGILDRVFPAVMQESLGSQFTAKVQGLTATAHRDYVEIGWTNPIDFRVTTIVVRAGVFAAPMTAESGSPVDVPGPVFPGASMVVQDSISVPGEYFFSVFAADSLGYFSQPETVRVTVAEVSGLDPRDEGQPPLMRAWPSVGDGNLRIEFRLAEESVVDLAVFDITGRLVNSLVRRERFAAGSHMAEWHGEDGQGRRVAGGIYFLRCRAAGQQRLSKVVVLR